MQHFLILWKNKQNHISESNNTAASYEIFLNIKTVLIIVPILWGSQTLIKNGHRKFFSSQILKIYLKVVALANDTVGASSQPTRRAS